MKNIYSKLLKIQKEINGLKKDKKSFGFDYVSGDKLLSFIKPLMNKNGLILKQEILSIKNVRQDYSVGGKKWIKDKDDKNVQIEYQRPKSEILSKVMMRFTWVDVETGDKDVNLFGANGQNGWDKGVGSALTYGERYFLLKYFHIATDEDDIDNPNLKPKEKGITTPTEDDRKPSLTTAQFKSARMGTQNQLKTVLDKYRMSETQRIELKNLLK